MYIYIYLHVYKYLYIYIYLYIYVLLYTKSIVYQGKCVMLHVSIYLRILIEREAPEA